MRYSIYILLGFIYTLMAVIAFYIARTIRREAKLEAQRRAAVQAATTAPDRLPAPAKTAP